MKAEDKDLEFLYNCSNDQLKLLVDFMVFDKDGKTRLTETLTVNSKWETCYPNNLVDMLPEIIAELQDFGGNTFFNLVRGHGVPYREILEKVCDKLNVNYNKNATTDLIEQYLLQKFLLMSIEKMTEEDVKHLSTNLTKESLKNQVGLLKAGSPVFIKMTTALVLNIAKKYGLKQAAAYATKFAGGRLFTIFTGPVGWVLTGLWTAFDIAGPAFRVMVPCTITIAYLRSISDKTEDELNSILG